jgi:cytochrome c oxidase assembly factor CtaG
VEAGPVTPYEIRELLRLVWGMDLFLAVIAVVLLVIVIELFARRRRP